jgi:hypothetical protein
VRYTKVLISFHFSLCAITVFDMELRKGFVRGVGWRGCGGSGDVLEREGMGVMSQGMDWVG